MSQVFTLDSDLGHFWEIIDLLSFSWSFYKARKELFDFAAYLGGWR